MKMDIMRAFLIAAFLCLTGVPAYALPPLDTYGGRMDISCTNATGVFTTVKLGGHWWFCTPAGHVFISMNMYMENLSDTECSINPNPYFAAKYAYGTDTAGTGANRTWQNLKRATSWGFNSVGQQTFGSYLPWYTASGPASNWPGGNQPIPLPIIIEANSPLNAMVNREGYAGLNQPVKSAQTGNDNSGSLSFGKDLVDVFDPLYSAEFNGELTDNTTILNTHVVANDPYVLGLIIGDTDAFEGFSPSPDFGPYATASNLGLKVLVTSPVQTLALNGTIPISAANYLYPNDTKYYSKANALNPGTCSIATPCSLRDYLKLKYVTIAALNTAWGTSGFYDTFDSDGVVTTTITGCTNSCSGNGVITTFTMTLTHTSAISPLSVLFSVGGVAEIGDYPWFKNAGTVNTGQLQGGTTSYNGAYNFVTGSTINYSTGAVSITFVTPPAMGAAITASYIIGGWHAGGHGLMDESGTNAWIGTNKYCIEGADSNYPTYFACTGAGGVFLPVPNANATLGADIDNWVPQFVAKNLQILHDDLRAAGSNILFFGLDSLGGWGLPQSSQVLKGTGQCIGSGGHPCSDVMETQFYWFMPANNNQGQGGYNSPGPSPQLASSYQYVTRYLGDMAIASVISSPPAFADSSESCNGGPGGLILEQPNQATRGNMYYNTVNYLLTTNGFNGDKQLVAFNQWAWQDFQNENWGLVSLRDNAYDGVEAVSARVSCDANYIVVGGAMCGGESANYGDAIGASLANGGTKIYGANQLWLAIGTPLTPGATAPAPQMMVRR